MTGRLLTGLRVAVCSLLLANLFSATVAVSAEDDADAVRITILLDGFGRSALEKGWGYSALVEYRGRRGMAPSARRATATAP